MNEHLLAKVLLDKESLQTVGDLMEVRIILEASAAALAAKRRTEKDVEMMRKNLKEMAKRIKHREDIEDMIALSQDFHFHIIAATKNTVLIKLYRELFALLKLSRHFTLQDFSSMEFSLMDHEGILYKIDEGDAEGARRNMRLHLEKALEKLGKIGREYEISALFKEKLSLSENFKTVEIEDIYSKHYDNVDAADIMHQVSNLYVSTKAARDYGNGEKYTSVEVHTLKYIADNQGVLSAKMALDMAKTKGAVSQILKKLEAKDIIQRREKGRLYLTEKGKELDFLHRKYDDEHFGESLDRLRGLYSQETIDQTFQILESWLHIRRHIHIERLKE